MASNESRRDAGRTGERTGAGVRVERLTWRPYGRREPVLHDLWITVAPGERVLLAGPSGSGKSTLLRAFAGLLLTADSGELSGSVLIDGAEPQDAPGSVGLVLQDPGAGVVATSLARDVAFGLENVSVPREEMPPRVAAALAEVGLTMGADASPATLSGGESQRLALAGALVMEPRVLLLDEPTAMLDHETAATVRSVVRDVVARRGLTLVVVEHRIDGWVDQVDRLVVLDAQGRIVADGVPGDVLARHADTLVEQGIWVPGAPEPEPLALDVPPLPGAASGRLAAGELAVAASDVSVVHRSSRLGVVSRVTEAVQGASLDVHAGEVVALVGPSGAGKSSLMGVVGGLRAPSAGSVDFALPLTPGESVSGSGSEARVRDRVEPPHAWASTDLARVVGWVPQRAATAVVGRTVRDDLLTTVRAVGLAGDLAGRPDGPSGLAGGSGGPGELSAAARADALLAALGLAHLAAADPRHLSGGEQRRLAVAAAAMHGPALLLADEPTVGQDRLTWSAVMGVLELARREGSALVVTTHDAGVTSRADRVVEMARPAVPGIEPPSQRRPLLSRVGPLALLLAGLAVLPLPALLSNWRQGLVVLAAEVVLGLVGLLAPGAGARPTGRIRGVLLRLAPAALAVFGVAWSAWLLGGRDLEVAASAALRVLCLVVPSAFVVGYIDPDRLADHLAQRLRLPPRPVVALAAALQRVQAFEDLWRDLMTTRRVRGIAVDRGLLAKGREAVAVTGALLVGALGQAATLALAMDARGFAEARRRTWAEPAPWRLPDTLVVLASMVVVCVAAVARWQLPG